MRTALANANANRPKGQIADDSGAWSISTTDQLLKASEYEPLIVAYRNGAPVRLGDVATVTDSVEDIRATGIADGKPSITVIIFRQPGANIIDTVDRVRALLPQLQAQIPADMKLSVAMDRTTTIRASVARRAVHADDLDRAGDPGRVSVSCAICGPRSFPASPCRSR